MNDLLFLLYESSIKLLQSIEKLSIEHKMLDTQQYLDWKDKLNTLSLDPDRD